MTSCVPVVDSFHALGLNVFTSSNFQCVADDRWGDWRPHLAMILSNTSSRPEVDHKAIMTLGDTLGNLSSV